MEGPRLKQTLPPIKAPHFFGAHTFIDHEVGPVLDFGFEVPKTLEGGSVLPLFQNPQATVQKDVFIEWSAGMKWIMTALEGSNRSGVFAMDNTS